MSQVSKSVLLFSTFALRFEVLGKEGHSPARPAWISHKRWIESKILGQILKNVPLENKETLISNPSHKMQRKIKFSFFQPGKINTSLLAPSIRGLNSVVLSLHEYLLYVFRGVGTPKITNSVSKTSIF